MSIEFDMPLKKSVTGYKQKTEIFSVNGSPTYWKINHCFRFLRNEMCKWLSLLHNFIQLSLNSGSDNGPGWK